MENVSLIWHSPFINLSLLDPSSFFFFDLTTFLLSAYTRTSFVSHSAYFKLETGFTTSIVSEEMARYNLRGSTKVI